MLFPHLKSFNLQKFVAEHRHEWDDNKTLRKLVWEDSDYIVMLQHGPTSDQQFHVNQGDEIFYQVEGELNFHYFTPEGQRELMVVGPGEMFHLTRDVPHSPRRPPGSWTLVVERKRREDERDGWIWFCEKCNHKLHETRVQSGGPQEPVPGRVSPWMAEARQKLTEMGQCPQCGEPVPLK
jgi:3-hydroxyanthranilate 3,4-dioxygenase